MLKQGLKVACTLAVLLLPLGSAGAQTPSGETMAAARELVTTMRMGDQFKILLPAIMQTMRGVITRNDPSVERDFDTTLPLLLEAMNARIGEFAELQAGIYAGQFTADELKELTAFYRQPIGQKMIERTPVIAQQSMAMGQVFGRRIGEELQSRMREELRKKGHAL